MSHLIVNSISDLYSGSQHGVCSMQRGFLVGHNNILATLVKMIRLGREQAIWNRRYVKDEFWKKVSKVELPDGTEVKGKHQKIVLGLWPGRPTFSSVEVLNVLNMISSASLSNFILISEK